MIKSIWCEDVTIPAEMKAGSRLTYTYISGGNYPDYKWSEVSSFIAVAEQSDIERAVESLLTQADDHDHVFIEGFDRKDDGSFEVVLGS